MSSMDLLGEPRRRMMSAAASVLSLSVGLARTVKYGDGCRRDVKDLVGSEDSAPAAIATQILNSALVLKFG